MTSSMTLMEKFVTIKKVGEVWVTEETLEKNFPKDCVVKCEVIDMQLDPDFPILLKQKGEVHYEVYSTSRERYRNTLERIRLRNEENEMSEKKVKCLHCQDELVGNKFSSAAIACKCGKVYMRGDLVCEGVEGKDFVDISPKLLNETA